ncbi:hypothetical protein [Photorhabdus khanii]|nr:hypothetical protein [Photorhabdus khanii]
MSTPVCRSVAARSEASADAGGITLHLPNGDRPLAWQPGGKV